MSSALGSLSASLSSSLSATGAEGTPRSLKKRPGPMGFKDFGGVDPFPSVGTPLADAGSLSPMKMSFDAPPQSYSPATGSKDGLSESKGLRPQLSLQLDKSMSGVDPMPSLEARRVPGVDPVPWDDEAFDPTVEGGDYMDFDDEDSALAQKQASPTNKP